MTRKFIIYIFTFPTALFAVNNSASAQNAQLIINELMQSNVEEIMDDLNEFPDSWVEIYNRGPVTAILSEYKIGITNNPSEAWTLPAVTLPAGGHQLIYCDKESQGLHTSFRLESGKGCQVYLFRYNTLVDQVEGLPKQPAPNIAYGRRTDGSDEWGYQLSTTPGKSNSGRICEKDQILGNPIFSEDGFVRTNASSFLLELSMPEGSPNGTVIYYTTNGKEPTINDRRYTSPIRISSTTVIRAKLFCDNWLSPPSTTQSYIFFPRKLTLPVISIATKDAYFNDSRIGLFPNNDTDILTYQHNWRRPINIEYFEEEGAGSIINQLGETRIGGGTTRENSKKTLIVYAHKRFGTKRFSHEFFPDQKPGLTDFKSLSLRNAGNDFNSLYMRDAVVQRHMGMNVDLDWQAWRPAIVYINGQYYGMLNIRERGNEDNVYTNHDGLEDIDLIENWDNLKEGDKQNLHQFKTFYNQSGHTLAEYERWMDCDEFINYMLLNLYHNNLDFPGNNCVMWRPRTTDGRWRWIAKDVDYSLGLYNISYNYKIFNWFYNPDYDKNWRWGANGYPYTLLFRQLMDDEDFRNLFLERCAIYMGDFLNEAGIRKIWDPMYEMIKYEYPYHRQQISKYPDYEKELTHARNWAAHRTDEFYRQVCSFYNAGTPVPLAINATDGEKTLKSLSFNNIHLSENHYDGKYFPTYSIRIQAEPADGMELIGWWIQQTTGNTTTSYEYMNTQLDMQMPECSKLVIEPICYNIANGIINVEHTNHHPSDVYDMNGRKVRSGSTSLEGLPSGIYIVEGKKVVK